MYVPKLFGRDLPSIVGWAEKLIVFLEDFSTASSGEVTAETAGFARLFYGTEVPSGWVKLDGSLLFISEAEELFNLIGLTFDPSPPANMFRLPPAPSGIAGAIWIVKK